MMQSHRIRAAASTAARGPKWVRSALVGVDSHPEEPSRVAGRPPASSYKQGTGGSVDIGGVDKVSNRPFHPQQVTGTGEGGPGIDMGYTSISNRQG